MNKMKEETEGSNPKAKGIVVKDLIKERIMAVNNRSNKVNIPEWAEKFPSMCYFQVIKKGVLQENVLLKEGCMSYVIGRSDEADAKLDHPLLSRAHLMIIYGKGIDSVDHKSRFWAADLYTQNKSKLNKQLMNPGQFYPLNFGFTIQLAEGSCLLVLESSNKNDYEQEDTETETEAEVPSSNSSDPKTFSYSIDFDEDTPVVATPKPTKNYEEIIKEYFDRKGLEPDYEVDTMAAGPKTTYVAKLSLTVYDSEGAELIAEGSNVKRNLAIAECAKNACAIIEQYDDLNPQNIETEIERRERVLVENDYYDDEDDAFFDRSGEVEKKRLDRMRRMGKCPQALETSETLVAKLDLVIKDILDIEEKLNKLNKDKVSADDEEDELDKYINDLQVKIDEKIIKELQEKLKELTEDRNKLEQRLGFSFSKASTLPVSSKTDEATITKEKGQVVYDKSKFGLQKDHAQSEYKEDSSSILAKDVSVNNTTENHEIKDKPKEVKEENKPKNDSNKLHSTKDKTSSEKRKKQENSVSKSKKTSKNQQKLINPELEKKYCSQEEEYDWIPPVDQLGDGVTPLNKKYNY